MTNETKFRKATKNKYYLWVCSVEGTNSHVNVMMHQPNQHTNGMLKDLTKFTLNETVITSMDFVKGKISSEDLMETNYVWIGSNANKLSIYAAMSPDKERLVAQINVPDTPTHIVYHMENVFVAMLNGNILMFRKDENDCWNLMNYKSLSLDTNKPISSMLPINQSIYAASGTKVFVLNGFTGDMQKQFEVQHSNEVSLMAHAGIGLWISLKNSGIICLYHTETFKHLKDINIAANVLRVTSHQKENVSSSNKPSSVFVTAMMACKGLLWVGTNVGIALTVPLPRLEGVPIISGGINISCHAHLGPITFFLPLITKSGTKLNQQSKETTANKQDDTNNNIIKENGSENGDILPETIPVSKKFEKQQSLDIPNSLTSSPSNRFKAGLNNSPVLLRRKSHGTRPEMDYSRMSKTLPRGFSSTSFYNTASIHSNSSSNSSSNGSEGCDVYGLYRDLLFVKEDIDGISSPSNLASMCDIVRRSDPDIAALPGKVDTLDRRLKMKVSRPRSLDLSNWSMESRSSSVYTSSGSEESVGIKHYRSVSRNSSNASHKFNGTELMHIHEYDHPAVTNQPIEKQLQKEIEIKDVPVPADNKTNTNNVQDKKETPVENSYATTTLKNNKRKNLKNQHHFQMVEGRRTVLTLMGGRGYVNWGSIWSNTKSTSNTSNNNSNNPLLGGSLSGGNDNKQSAYHLRSNSLTINHKLPNSTDAHIIIWEKKL